ncbi:MAG: 50S ribosomal protein L34e [Nitrososphaerota archaeon]|nr:50S ribosomal protein L34e [Candidatus Calditenuis fumarioli]
MPSRRLRVRKGIRRVFVRTPGGRTVVHYEDKRPNFRRCAVCGEVLHGIRRDDERPLPKSQKRVSRYHGGNVCHRCLESRIREVVMAEWAAQTSK